MTLAIMQPYIFPYIGYFQLVQAADKFVFYDDVNFIRQGWINRNNLLLNGAPHLFTVPLEKQSPNNLINEVAISAALYERWKDKFYKTLEQAYRKAPHYATVLELIKAVMESSVTHIGELAKKSIELTSRYMGLDTEFVQSSTLYENAELKSATRVLDICAKEGATVYINPIGGQELYNKELFREHGIDLYFLKAGATPYTQLKNEFVPYLSIIDVLMFNAASDLSEVLINYKLI